MSNPDIPDDKMGFYRAATSTGWATFHKQKGHARPSTEGEALTAEELITGGKA